MQRPAQEVAAQLAAAYCSADNVVSLNARRNAPAPDGGPAPLLRLTFRRAALAATARLPTRFVTMCASECCSQGWLVHW